MSDLFGSRPRPPRGGGGAPAPARPGRSRALLITAAIVVAALVLLGVLASFWTERLWYASIDFSGVFSTLIWTRVLLFAVGGVLMAVVVGVNMWLAYRFRPSFRPASQEQTSLDRYREAVTPIRVWLLVGISLLMGVFAGSSVAGQWRNFLLWRNSESFGQDDPFFNRDVGFYVFDLAWLEFMVDFAMALLVVGALAAAVVHYLYGGIRLQASRDKLSGAAQVQLSLLVGLLVLVKAVDYYLSRFALLTESGGYRDGITYTDDNAVLPARNILIGIAIICAVLFFVNIWRRTWMLPGVGLGLLVLSAILLGMVWPAIMQRFQVDPSQADREEPYIQRNIEATQNAFGIRNGEDVVYEGFQAVTNVRGESDEERQSLFTTANDSPGIRLVDPSVVQATFENLQQAQGYYAFAPVLDVDNYTLDGEKRDVVLGVRELNQAGIEPGSQNWANLATVYTHGYGVVGAFGNQRQADNQTPQTGDPVFVGDGAGGGEGFGDYEPRIYFGEQSPTYSIVGKSSEDANDLELDRPGSGDDPEGGSRTTYDGADGVSVGNLFNKVLYAIKFGEPNIVLSGRVNENSKILYDREPARRVEKVAPWLTVDSDPYPAIVDGRVLWIIDGYTTTDKYPQAQQESFDTMTDDALANDNPFQTLPTDQINYMRNAVKATVDAYDGTVTLYAWDESDPLLKAWRGIFPDTVEDRDQISDELLQHMRYPEDLWKVQRYHLARYHVDNASDFYQANDRWEVPTDPSDSSSLQPPYRLSVPNADGADVFSLTSVFTPFNRENLVSFVSVDADASQDEYGTIRIRRLENQVAGPGQIANRIRANDDVTELLRRFSAETDTEVVNGNLLTIPVGDGLLYVQPLYTLRTSGDGNYPTLEFVAVSFGGDDVGIGRNLSVAARDVLGLAADDTPTPTPDPGGEPGDEPDEPAGTPEEQIGALLDRADQLFAQADEALADGDLGEYGSLVGQAQDLVSQALALAQEAGLTGTGGGGDGDAPADDSTEESDGDSASGR